LFAAVSPPGSVFDLVLEKFFQGVRDERTLRLMGVARLAANRWQSHGQSKIAIALTTRLLSVLISERPRRYRTRQHSLALSPVVSHPDLAPIDSPRSRLTGHYTAGKQVPFPAGIGRCQERKALGRPHATPPGADVWRREPSPTAAIIVQSQLWGFEVRKRNSRYVMKDQDKSKEQLIAELVELRQRVAESDASRSSSGDGRAEWESSNSRWLSLVTNTPVFILVLDQDHRICWANRTESGEPTSRILGKHIDDFCRPQDQEDVRACVEQVFQTGQPVRCEGPGLCSDGQDHWYASHFGPIFTDGQVVAVSLVSINFTDRKQAEEAVRQSEQRMRLHVQQTPLAVIEWDLEFRVTRWNPAAERVFGYSEQEALGQHYSFVVAGRRP
jgi:PAS domain S-box-containing protein